MRGSSFFASIHFINKKCSLLFWQAALFFATRAGFNFIFLYFSLALSGWATDSSRFCVRRLERPTGRAQKYRVIDRQHVFWYNAVG